MNIRTMRKLERLGWNKDWLTHVKEHFHPKRHGKYKIKIYDIEHLDQDPETGIYIDTAYFDTDVELSIIHFFFEGCAYVMTDVSTDKTIGMGIIDGAPFEELDDHEGKDWGTWQWHGHKAPGSMYEQWRKEFLQKVEATI